MDATITKSRHPRASMYMLALCNVASLLAAINLVLVLNPEDRVSIKRGAALTALGFVYFITLFELLNVVGLCTGAGARFRHKYSLTAGDVMDINNKVVSGVQAVWSCVAGAVVCTWSCPRDFLRASHFMSEAYAWFGAAYFFYDIWSMYTVYVQMKLEPQKAKKELPQKTNGNNELDRPRDQSPDKSHKVTKPSFFEYIRYDPVIVMHHLFIGGFGFLVIVYLRGGLGDCAFGVVYLMELSTPCVSARGVLARLRRKAGRLYRANGLAMLLAFLCARVLALPAAAALYARARGAGYWQALGSLPTGCKISIAILMLPQFYWFYLMSKGAIKLFLSPPAPSHSSPPPVPSGGDAKRS